MRLLLKIAVLFIATISQNALAVAKNHERYWPARILDVEQTSKSVAVTYLLPCGSEYFGTYVTPSSNGVKNLMSIGVILSRHDARCTGLSRSITIKHKSLSQTFTYKASQTSFHFTSKDQFHPTDLVSRQLTPKGKSKMAELVYVKMCRQPNYLIVREYGPRVAVALASLGRKKSSMAKLCKDPELRTIAVPTLDTKRVRHLDTLAMQAKPGVSERLKLSVKPAVKVRNNLKSGITVTYQRRCNEVGLGISLTQTYRKKSRTFVKAGVLVAEVPVACDTRTRRRAVISNSKVSLPPNVKFARSLPFGTKRPIQIEPVYEYARRSKGKQTAVKLFQVSSCEQTLAAVYAVDSYNKLSVGLLKRGESPNCSRKFRKSHFEQELIFTSREKGFFPLKLVNNEQRI